MGTSIISSKPIKMAKRDRSPETPDRLPAGSLKILQIPVVIAVLGYLYYTYLHATVVMVAGFDRTTYALSKFPYDCHRAHHVRRVRDPREPFRLDAGCKPVQCQREDAER